MIEYNDELFEDLQDLTSYESGAVQYSDGEVWVGNWVGISGIPRYLAPLGMIGLGGELVAKDTEPPHEVIEAMKQHEIDLGCEPDTAGYRAWEINEEAIVVISKGWN